MKKTVFQKLNILDSGQWVVVAISTGIAITLIYLLVFLNRAQINKTTEIHTDDFTKIFTKHLEVRLTALDTMATKIVNSSEQLKVSWHRDAESYYNLLDSFEKILWVNQELQTVWVYPSKGNMEELHLVDPIFTQNKERFVNASKNTSGTLSRALKFNLSQKGFFSIHPSFDSLNYNNGFLIGFFDANKLYEGLKNEKFIIKISLDREILLEDLDEGKKLDWEKTFSVKRKLKVRNKFFVVEMAPSKSYIRQTVEDQNIVLTSVVISILCIALGVFISRLIESKNKIANLYSNVVEMKKCLDEVAIYAETDRKGKIVDVNPKFCAITGYDKEELIGKTHSLINSGYHSKKFFKEMWKKIGSGEVWRGEIKNRGKHNQIYWVDTTIFPVFSENGRIKGFQAIRLDITERKNLESNLLDEKLKAEQAAETKSKFLANMSHEIRTPLNGILGITELLQDQKLDKPVRDQVNLILESGNNLLMTLNSILDFSKLEAQQTTVESVPFEMHSLLQSLMVFFAPVSEKKGIVLEFISNEVPPPVVNGDPTKVKQICSNLISNAIKFTDKGSITVGLKYSDVGDEISFKISVKDTGIGISPEAQKRLFLPFSQVDGSTTREFGGTGLGLSISMGLANTLNGRITCNSKRDKGAEFVFNVSFYKSHPQVSADQVKEGGNQQSINSQNDENLNLHILVVEDNAVNQLVLKGMLRKFGCTMELAADGIEAVEKASQTRFDVILMDFNMPKMDGIEATKTIIAENEMAPPIVGVTASITDADRQRFLQAGMCEVVCKPVKSKVLRDCLRELSERMKNPNVDLKVG